MPIVPCGLIAWSLFNDTYSFSRNSVNLTVNKTEISWKSDRDHKFGSDVFPKNFQNGSLVGGGHLDEHTPVSRSLNSNFDWLKASMCIILVFHKAQNSK